MNRADFEKAQKLIFVKYYEDFPEKISDPDKYRRDLKELINEFYTPWYRKLLRCIKSR